MTGLQHLAALDLETKRQRHPNMPAYAVPASKFSDKTANDLTRAIVRLFQVHGHFATRLQSTGTFRDDLKMYVPSQQRKGLPDVFAVVGGRAVFVEIKAGKDRLSDDQKKAISLLTMAGAAVYVATTFQDFYDWFLSFSEEEPLPFGPSTLFSSATSNT